jgi:hypothetical protein
MDYLDYLESLGFDDDFAGLMNFVCGDKDGSEEEKEEGCASDGSETVEEEDFNTVPEVLMVDEHHYEEKALKGGACEEAKPFLPEEICVEAPTYTYGCDLSFDDDCQEEDPEQFVATSVDDVACALSPDTSITSNVFESHAGDADVIDVIDGVTDYVMPSHFASAPSEKTRLSLKSLEYRGFGCEEECTSQHYRIPNQRGHAFCDLTCCLPLYYKWWRLHNPDVIRFGDAHLAWGK